MYGKYFGVLLNIVNGGYYLTGRYFFRTFITPHGQINITNGQRKERKMKKTKRHRKIGEMLSPTTKIVSYFSKVENEKTRGWYEVQCLDCYQKTPIRSDNLDKFVSCKCQSRSQFKSDYELTQDFYSWDDIQFLARKYKVSSSNIISQLKKAGIPYEAKARCPGQLTLNEEKKAIDLAKIGFSRSQIAAKLQTDVTKLPPDLETINKMENYKRLAPIYKELRLQGFTIKEIAEQNNTNISTVTQYLNKLYGKTFTKEATLARKRNLKAKTNRFLMRSDHRLSQSALRQKNSPTNQ